jgi:hypothetical protein
MSGWSPEGFVAVILLVTPLVVGVASFWPSARGHWSGPVLAAPALLFGVGFTRALFRGAAVYGGWASVVYGPLLMVVAIISITLWQRRR